MITKQLKQELELYLSNKVVDIPIKWDNTSIYTLNNNRLSESQISDLVVFLCPKIIPISYDKQIINSPKGYQNKLFFQIDIYVKQNTGTGMLLEISDTLTDLFKEHKSESGYVEKIYPMIMFESREWIINPIRFTVAGYSS